MWTRLVYFSCFLQTEEADVSRHSSHKHDKKQKKKSKDHRRSRSFGPGDQLAVSKYVKLERWWIVID